MRARRTTAVAAALLLTGAVAACTPDGATPPASTVTATTGPAQVTLAVYGPDPVISAYTTLAATFTDKFPSIAVNVRPYATHDEAMHALARTVGTGRAPDIFLAGASDLDSLEADKANTRVDELLSERNIDFGDGYERVGLEAFSDNNALQCMPVDVSPLVVYYNAGLVHLAKLRLPGQTVPSSDIGWRFQDFVTAAEQASGFNTRGVYVAPQLEQIAPFVLSGGGQVVDDTAAPMSLQLGSGASVNAMRQLLQLVRRPELTFTPQQLARKDALTRFKEGRLGMLVGFRDLTPELRKQEGLNFGVMPMPRIGKQATVADVSGLCVKPKAANSQAVGDFLAYLVGDQASKVLASTGYVTPANSDALHSDDFAQPTLDPNGSNVFVNQMRFVNELPRSSVWSTVEKAVDNRLYRLFYDPLIDPLDARLTAIDEASKTILAPPSASPSATPSR
ncbi:MAG: sugar ABC transporter substrate-binding protein [Marmoricola sp.]